jgi:hypothetical protein
MTIIEPRHSTRFLHPLTRNTQFYTLWVLKHCCFALHRLLCRLEAHETILFMGVCFIYF